MIRLKMKPGEVLIHEYMRNEVVLQLAARGGSRCVLVISTIVRLSRLCQFACESAEIDGRTSRNQRIVCGRVLGRIIVIIDVHVVIIISGPPRLLERVD